MQGTSWLWCKGKHIAVKDMLGSGTESYVTGEKAKLLKDVQSSFSNKCLTTSSLHIFAPSLIQEINSLITSSPSNFLSSRVNDVVSCTKLPI